MSPIGKKLITKNNIDDYLTDAKSSVTIGSDMILTQGAIDILRNKGIAIHYGKEKLSDTVCPADHTAGPKDLQAKIEAVLKQEYNIHQPEALQEIIALVLKKV